MFAEKPEKRQFAIPERLLRLDRDFENETAKRFDELFAVRQNGLGENYRIKVTVTRIAPRTFVATCCVGGKVHRRTHSTPSGAFVLVVDQLSWTVSRMSCERNISKSELSMQTA